MYLPNVTFKTVGVAVCIVAFAISMVVMGSRGGLMSEANKIVSDCGDKDDEESCYEAEVPTLYPGYTAEAVFEIVRLIRKKDPSYQFCHVLAHKLGERMVAEDPSQWLDLIPLNPPDGLCSNGFIHGVVGGRFRSEVLDDATIEKFIPDFGRACEPRVGWSPTGLDQAICYHGLGHLYMFVTDGDVPKALSICERTATPSNSTGDYRRVCREGVFMQIYQPLEPDDFLLIERMKDKPSDAGDVRRYCAQFVRDEYEGACLRESWPLFDDELHEGRGVDAFCVEQPNETEELACYQSVTAIVGRGNLKEPAEAARICDEVQIRWRGLCYTTVARTVLEEDRDNVDGTIALCERARDASVREECLSTLASDSRFFFGTDTDRARKFCAAFPDQYQRLCGR